MKNVKLLILYFFILILSGCDTEGEYTDAGYTSFEVKIEWQADADVVYKMTFNNDTIKQKTGIIVPIEQTSGILRVYRNNETSPELEKEVAIENGVVLSLIQLPGSAISFSPTEDEKDPSESSRIKVRFFYNGIEGIGNSAKVDIFTSTDLRTWDSVGSITLEEGKLSSYVELNLNHFFPASTRSAYFCCDITDLATGVMVAQHTRRAGLITFGSSSFDSVTGFKAINKFATCQMAAPSTYRFDYVFGTAWGK
ncbi:hypothetical protein [Bacteroides ihuae]|uniref:hypothetical protein n=1 Tax=Bacteroides ihuae TaxID=1852362 RepID=UPI0008D9385D|nr:hypothetical protein [Bacteroides ihuae]